VSHGAICPCPNCSGGGKGCLVLLVAAAVVLAVGAGFAARAGLHWLAAHPADDVLMACPLLMGGFGLACRARERRGKEVSARVEQQQQLRRRAGGAAWRP